MSIEKKIFTFEILAATIRKIFSKRDLEDVKGIGVRRIINNVPDQLNLEFFKKYVAKTQKETIVFYIPKTWKDHFKKTHRNKWWMKRWIRKHPIVSKRLMIDLKKIHIFPEVDIPDYWKDKTHIVYLEGYPHEP